MDRPARELPPLFIEHPVIMRAPTFYQVNSSDVYLIGNSSFREDDSRICFKIDLKRGELSSISRMLEGVYQARVCGIQNLLVVFTPRNITIQAYDFVSDKWKELPSNPTSRLKYISPV